MSFLNHLFYNFFGLFEIIAFKTEKYFSKFKFHVLIKLYRGKRFNAARALKGETRSNFFAKKSNFWWHKVRTRGPENQVSFSIFTSFLAAFFLFLRAVPTYFSENWKYSILASNSNAKKVPLNEMLKFLVQTRTYYILRSCTCTYVRPYLYIVWVFWKRPFIRLHL